MNTATAVTIIISVPGVIALVNLVKSRVTLGKWAALVAFVLGIALNMAAYLAHAAYVGENAFAVVCVGAIVGLSAAGIYDIQKQPEAVTDAWIEYFKTREAGEEE